MTITVGAGLGGLALARVLHMNGIDAVVYEREPSRGARGQGGMLDLHSGTGQRAMRVAGLIDQFHAIARREGQDLRLLEPDGTLLLQRPLASAAPEDQPDPTATEFETSGHFSVAGTRRYVWARRYTADEYIALLDTFSGHIAMEPAKRRHLYHQIRRILAARPDGRLTRHWSAVLTIGRRI